MYVFLGLTAFLTLFASVRAGDDEPTPIPIKAKVSVSQGEARLFSEEDVQLTCSVPDQPAPKWSYHWFLNGNRLPVTGVYTLTKAAVEQGGRYTCQGEKDIEAWPYSLLTLPSEPLHVDVDGGWVLLQVPAEPLLIEETMTLTCRIRDDPMQVEVIFYKDGVEIRRQKEKDLVIPNLTLKDEGTYWCRATWIQRRFEYHAAQSRPVFVAVLDKLNTPSINMEPNQPCLAKGQRADLMCVTQLNVREEGLKIDYYFMKDEARLGPPSSQNTYTIQRAGQDDAGNYTCKARVRALKLERWSSIFVVKLKDGRECV